MTWARTLATGNGTVSWRVSVDGMPYEAVSHRGMSGFRKADALANTLAGNLLPAPGSETWTGSSASVTTGIGDPAGGTSAVTITDASAVAFGLASTGAESYTSGNAVRVSVWVKKNLEPTAFAVVGIDFANGDFAEVALRLDTGAAQLASQSGGMTSAIKVTDFGAWWFVTFAFSGSAAGTTVAAYAFPAYGTAIPTAAASAMGACTVYGARVADATADPIGADPLRITRERCLGLKSDGFKFAESVYLPTASWDPQGMRVTVAQGSQGSRDHRFTELFSKKPGNITWLSADLSTSATSVTVSSTAGFPSTGYIYLDGETIAYTSTDATHFLGCTRGAFGSLATAHYQSFGANLRNPEVTDWPVSIEGRRVRLFAYGHGDDYQGEGTRVWTGIARTEPAYNGLTWSFNVDSLGSILDFELGGDLEEARSIRGIYYSWRAPLYLWIGESVAATFPPTIEAETELALAGFWETQESFCDALSALIATAITGGNTITGTFTQGPIRAVPYGASWCLQYTTTSGSFRIVEAMLYSPTDGGVELTTVDAATGRVPTIALNADTTYQLRLVPTAEVPTPGEVPRASLSLYGSSVRANDVAATNASGIDPATNPQGRLYLSGTAPTSAVTEVQVTWPALTATGEATIATLPVVATDTAINYVTGDHRRIPFPSDLRVSGITAEAIEIKMTRTLAIGNLRTFLQALEDQTALYVTAGGTPFIRPTASGNPADFDLSTSEGSGGYEIDAAALGAGPIAESRVYSLLAPVKLRELVEHECRLIGVYPCTNAVGQITFKRLALPTPTSRVDATLSASHFIVDDNFFSYERMPFGTFNSVSYELGYNPAEDKSMATPVLVRDVASFGRNPIPRVLAVAPKSVDPTGHSVTLAELARLASRVLGVFGAPYAVLTIKVPLRFFNVTLGQVLSITWSKVPSGGPVGTVRARALLGVTDRLGLVISREFTPMEAHGQLTVLLTDQRVGGYAPSGKVVADSVVDVGGNSYVVTLSTEDFPSGTTAEDFFFEDYKIRLFEWNSTNTSNNVTGDVTGVVGNDVAFVASGPWTHAGATWVLGFDVSTNISAAGQKAYVCLAGADGVIDWADGTSPAFTFA